jgi:beta-galactosidase
VVALTDGGTGRIWTELLHLDGAEAVTSYVDGPLPGSPAVTRHQFGGGIAHYVTTVLDAPSTTRLLDELCREAGVRGPTIAETGVETVRRRHANASYLFVINHTEREVEMPTAGTDLLTGRAVTGAVTVPAGGVAVVRESPAAAELGRE